MEGDAEDVRTIRSVVASINTMRLEPPPPVVEYKDAWYKCPSPPKKKVAEAIKSLDSVEVKRLVTTVHKDWNVNETNMVNCQSVLIQAVQTDRADVVRAVLSHPKIDINLVGPGNTTALQSACADRYLNSLLVLLGRPELDPNIKCPAGFTAIGYAVIYGRCDIIREFIASGISFELPADLDKHYEIMGTGAEQMNKDQRTARGVLKHYQTHPLEARKLALGCDQEL
jgi:hypothetical protein